MSDTDIQNDRFRPVVFVVIALFVVGAVVGVVIFTAPLWMKSLRAVAAKGATEGAGSAAGAVAWSGGGRYAVVQFAKTTSVGVWDRVTKKSRIVKGFRLVAVEPEAPYAWLVRDDGKDASSDVSGDSIDRKPSQLYSWNVADAKAQPTSEVESRWQPWEGSGDYDAYVEVDILKGADPARINFNNKARSGDGTKAAVPADVDTFEPIGWSKGGDYFAVVSLSSTESTPTTAELVVFAAQDGSVAQTMTIAARRGGPNAVWSLVDDEIYAVAAPNTKARAFGLVKPVEDVEGSKPVAVLAFDQGMAAVSDAQPIAYDPRGGRIWLSGGGLSWAKDLSGDPQEVMKP